MAEMDEGTKKKHVTIRLPPKASQELKQMADEEGVTVNELIRRAINFYDVRMEAKRKDKKIILEDERGGKEWVMV